jgi:hypothetical protein
MEVIESNIIDTSCTKRSMKPVYRNPANEFFEHCTQVVVADYEDVWEDLTLLAK